MSSSIDSAYSRDIHLSGRHPFSLTVGMKVKGCHRAIRARAVSFCQSGMRGADGMPFLINPTSLGYPAPAGESGRVVDSDVASGQNPKPPGPAAAL